jgi:hypothetical protein
MVSSVRQQDAEPPKRDAAIAEASMRDYPPQALGGTVANPATYSPAINSRANPA